MEVRIMNGVEAEKYLNKEGETFVCPTKSHWFGYVEGKGLIRTWQGSLLCYASKKVATIMFNTDSPKHFKGEFVKKRVA